MENWKQIIYRYPFISNTSELHLCERTLKVRTTTGTIQKLIVANWVRWRILSKAQEIEGKIKKILQDAVFPLILSVFVRYFDDISFVHIPKFEVFQWIISQIPKYNWIIRRRFSYARSLHGSNIVRNQNGYKHYLIDSIKYFRSIDFDQPICIERILKIIFSLTIRRCVVSDARLAPIDNRLLINNNISISISRQQTLFCDIINANICRYKQKYQLTTTVKKCMGLSYVMLKIFPYDLIKVKKTAWQSKNVLSFLIIFLFLQFYDQKYGQVFFCYGDYARQKDRRTKRKKYAKREELCGALFDDVAFIFYFDQFFVLFGLHVYWICNVLLSKKVLHTNTQYYW